MAFTVVLRRRAQADIASQIGWLATHRSAAAAARWRAGFLTFAVPELEQNPHRYPEADEATDLGIDLRQLVYGRGRQVYRVLFTIGSDTVNVHRVRHSAQDRLSPGDV